MSILKGYIASNPELDTEILGKLRYLPSVSEGKTAVLSAAKSMQSSGMLSATTNIEKLSSEVFVELEGVNDAWVEKLTVDKVAFGQVPDDQAQRVAMELYACGGPLLALSCCELTAMVKP